MDVEIATGGVWLREMDGQLRTFFDRAAMIEEARVFDAAADRAAAAGEMAAAYRLRRRARAWRELLHDAELEVTAHRAH